MSNEAADAPTRDEEHPEPTTFTLVIVSPSVGVTGPLTFPHLLADTTVKQLKARIRDVLPTKPADENQRLIHRGRLLGRETETMTEIFGLDTLVNPESQTLHLVLRPATTDVPPPQAPLQPMQAQAPSIVPHANVHTAAQPPRMPPPPRNLAAGLPAQQPLPGFQAVQHLAHIHHQQHHFQASMNVRLQQLQQEADRIQQRLTAIDQIANGQNPAAPGPNYTLPPPPPTLPQIFGNPQAVQGAPAAGLPSFQNLIAQHQRDRAAEGMHGASGHSTPSGLPQPPFSSRASPSVHRPDHSTTYTREGVGPNGERWHVTVNETTTTIPNPAMQSNGQANGQLNGQTTGNIYETYPALDVQRALRSADRAPNDRTSLNRTQSSSPPAGSSQAVAAQELAIPSTTPRATSLPNTSSPALSLLPNSTASASALVEPVVYILSSPTGPRALLVNNSESFYTPRQQVSLRGRADVPGGFINPSDIALRNRGDRAARRAIRRGQVPQAAGPEAPVLGHQGNPGAGALAAQFWPHIWLIIRLLIFVWFFTSGNTSWQRVFMISALAIIVFIAHTGALNGIAESLWGPIRRHVDRLLPLAGPEAALVPAVNAAIPQAQPGEVRTQGNGPGTQLDEAEVAARFLEQRRQANGGWLMAQIRRAEHAMLLFLASLVPGVGERHIAAREAEAVAAEQRRIEATNAAEAQNQAQPEAGSEEAARANAAGENPAQIPDGAEAPAHVEAPLVEA